MKGKRENNEIDTKNHYTTKQNIPTRGTDNNIDQQTDYKLTSLLITPPPEAPKNKKKRQSSVNLTYDHGTALKISSAIRNDVSHHRQAGCIPQSRLDPREEFYKKTYAGRFGPYIYEKSSTTSGN